MPTGIYKRTEKHRKILSKAQKKKWQNPENKIRRMEQLEKIKNNSIIQSKRIASIKKYLSNPENHWNWQGGKSFEPYSIEFNENLKEQVRNRDKRICQICKNDKKQNNNRKLTIHHIDSNKKNCKKENLLTLCLSCNNKVSFNTLGLYHWEWIKC